MPRAIHPTYLAISLLCSACGDAPSATSTEGADGTGTTESDTTSGVDLPVQVCESQVFVGRVGFGQTCIDHGGWAAAALGDAGILGEFCEYTWQGDALPDLATLPAEEDGVHGLLESCPRVVPQADPFAAVPALRTSLHDAFMKTVGKVALPFVGDPGPRLYLVDTIPDALLATGLQPNEPHGLRLRELTEGMLCDAPAACPIGIANVLGLPRITPKRVDHERGGVYGSLMDLARGIDEAVEDWEKRGDTAHLVLALAVGWEPLDAYGPALAGKTLDELLALGGAATDVQAVLAASTRALCHDALLVAAVGNATGEPCAQTGAVGPAFLQSLLAPTTAQCEAAGFAHDGLTNDGAAFLLSVSHVGLAGQPLANTRPDAPAGVTAQGSTFSTVEGTSALLTGSSVATAVTAAAATALWAVYPDLSRNDVFASLRAASGPTGVSICGALQHACNMSDGQGCMALACPSPDAAVQQAADVVDAAIEPPCSPNACSNVLELGADFPDNQSLDENACGTPTTVWPSVPLPPVSKAPLLPWTTPQPKKPYCPTCIIKYTDDPQQLTLGLALASTPTNDYPLLIEVETAVGVERYPIDPKKLARGERDVNLVTIRPAQSWPEVKHIRLSYYVQDTDGSLHLESEPLLRSPGRKPECGNGKIEGAEQCDNGPDMPGDDCHPDCTLIQPVCGNAKVEGVEACDDGNQTPNDGCENDCSVTPSICGNAKVESGEVCDDGNVEDGDGCSADCTMVTIEAICGNGKVELGEICDDGDQMPGDGCESDCTITPAVCGNGKVEGDEPCDDGNQVDGGPDDFCKNDCTVFVPPSCEAPVDYVICDADLDLGDKNDKTQAHKAMGICNQKPTDTVQISDFDLQSQNDAAWQVARGFGTYAFDQDNDPNTPDKLLYSPREGDSFLMVSTGVIKAPNAQGIVVESPNSQVANGDNGNDDTDDLPAPLQSKRGSANGAGGTPFQDCDGVNDCSDTLQAQWQLGGNNPNDKLWFTFKTTVPEGTFGYTFDFVFCSSEWPTYVNTGYNDLLIAWQTDPSADDPNADPPVAPYTGNVTFIPDPNDAKKGLPLTITALDPYFDSPGFTGNEPQLAGTGFEAHACTDWIRAKGAVQPGAEITIGFFLADMSDSILATLAILDKFRWECEGCVPGDLGACGVTL